MDKKINIDLIIERLMIAFNCTTQRQLADIFKISPEDFSSRKRRGTLTKLIEKESFRRNISYDWLKTGQGNMMADTETHMVAEPHAPYIGTTEPSQAKNNDPDWALKALILEIQEQLKAQRDFNAKINQSILIKKKTHIDLWDVINRQQSMIDEISKTLIQVGISGDLNLLKKLGGDG